MYMFLKISYILVSDKKLTRKNTHVHGKRWERVRKRERGIKRGRKREKRREREKERERMRSKVE